MPAKLAIPVVTPAELDPARAMRLVRAQLDKLAELQQLGANDGVPKEEAWRQVTDAILHRAFASNSSILAAFSWARTKGSYTSWAYRPAKMRATFVRGFKDTNRP